MESLERVRTGQDGVTSNRKWAESATGTGSRPGAGSRSKAWLAQRPALNKLIRYVLTSGVATVVSEVTLIAVYASGALGASGASIVANLAGALPSYLLSRYWIWSEADRRGAARQVGLYWATSVVSLLVSTAGTSLAAAHAPDGRLAHVMVVGTAYVGSYAVLWVAKYMVYQRVIFKTVARPRPAAAA